MTKKSGNTKVLETALSVAKILSEKEEPCSQQVSLLGSKDDPDNILQIKSISDDIFFLASVAFPGLRDVDVAVPTNNLLKILKGLEDFTLGSTESKLAIGTKKISVQLPGSEELKLAIREKFEERFIEPSTQEEKVYAESPDTVCVLRNQEVKCFHQGLKYVTQATFEDGYRTILKYAYFGKHNEDLALVGTDGHRLHLSIVNRKMSFNNAREHLLIPAKVCGVLDKLLALGSSCISFSTYRNCIVIDIGEFQISYEIPNVEFPNYNHSTVMVEEKKTDCTAVVLFTKDLQEAVDMLKKTEPADDKVTITFCEKDGKRVPMLKAENEEGSSTEIVLEGQDGVYEKGFEVACSIVYLKEALSNGSGMTRIQFADDLGPILLTFDTAQTLAIIMPIRSKTC